MNGATCNDQVNTYSCACAAGYSGDMCETGNLESWISVFYIVIICIFTYSSSNSKICWNCNTNSYVEKVVLSGLPYADDLVLLGQRVTDSI